MICFCFSPNDFVHAEKKGAQAADAADPVVIKRGKHVENAVDMHPSKHRIKQPTWANVAQAILTLKWGVTKNKLGPIGAKCFGTTPFTTNRKISA